MQPWSAALTLTVAVLLLSGQRKEKLKAKR